jgi:hypothetical protein
LSGDDSASSPVGGIGAAFDEPRRFQIIEEVGHDRSVDSEVLGQGKLAADSALGGGGKDLVSPRAPGKVGHRSVRCRGVRPQDHAQAPSEVACQRADAAGGAANAVTVTRNAVHGLIIAKRALFARSSCAPMICF